MDFHAPKGRILHRITYTVLSLRSAGYGRPLAGLLFFQPSLAQENTLFHGATITGDFSKEER
jgi:hypothetical protein